MRTTSARPGLPARAGLVALTALGLGLGLSACAGPGAAPAVDSVGHISGSTALVAVVADGDTVSAYVCDGPNGTGERFTGALDADRHADLHSVGGAQLSVDVGAATAQGVFVPAGGQPQQFSTEAATSPDAGLFLADGTTPEGAYSAGWVLLNDGTQNGALREKFGKPKRAPRLEHRRDVQRGERAVLAEGDRTNRGAAPAPRSSDGQVVIAPRVPSGSTPRSTGTAQAPDRSEGRVVRAPRTPSEPAGTAQAADDDRLVRDGGGSPLRVDEAPARGVPGGSREVASEAPLRATLDDGTPLTPRRVSEPRAILAG
jgi:hypothetical protein